MERESSLQWGKSSWESCLLAKCMHFDSNLTHCSGFFKIKSNTILHGQYQFSNHNIFECRFVYLTQTKHHKQTLKTTNKLWMTVWYSAQLPALSTVYGLKSPVCWGPQGKCPEMTQRQWSRLPLYWHWCPFITFPMDSKCPLHVLAQLSIEDEIPCLVQQYSVVSFKC